MDNKIHVVFAIGTRPEGIKCAPIIAELRKHNSDFCVTVVSTGQHTDMLRQALEPFGIVPDIDMQLMLPKSDLCHLMSAIISNFSEHLRQQKPDIVLVQGDTTTALAAAMTAFAEGIPVGHIEAGLRSFDPSNPFPEEVNRCAISLYATLHFAPTTTAETALLHERISPCTVAVTGNTVVDSLLHFANTADKSADSIIGRCLEGRRILLVTAHRRESWGDKLENICAAVLEIAQRYPDVLVVFPVHKNPVVATTVHTMLGGVTNICLLEPLDYFDFLVVMRAATLILTDSGGVQEEAPTFRVPVLIMRDVTERTEALNAKLSKLVGTQTHIIIDEVCRLLDDNEKYESMRTGTNPFGDGQASTRIAQCLLRWKHRCSPLLPADASFVP